MERTVAIRGARAQDFDRIAAVVDEWWGRSVVAALPRLFLDHFWASSLIADDDRGLAGFLIGFVSPSESGHGYIHFVGVRPEQRGNGLARLLYEKFSAQVAARGCTLLRAITAPGNEVSIRFHQHLGFAVSPPIDDYNGPGRPMIVFQRHLDTTDVSSIR